MPDNPITSNQVRTRRPIIKWLIVIAIGLLVLAVSRFVIAPRYNPTQAELGTQTYHLVRLQSGESEVINVLDRRDSIAFSFAGTTDMMCDPPYAMLVDADGDNANDLYFHNCSGHGVLRYDRDSMKLVYKNFGQSSPANIPAASGFLWKEIESQGWTTMIAGIAIIAAGLIGAAISSIISLRRH